MTKIRVLLVDDHTLFRSGLKMLLRDLPDIEVVGEAVTGQEAVDRARELAPDIVLLDLSLPDASGISILGKLARVAPAARAIVVTMHNDAALVRASLGAGARGYLVKTAADTELITAIRSVAMGRTFVDLDLPPSQLGTLLDSASQAASAAEHGPLARMTKREREVFRQLAHGHTNQKIAEQLDISVKTVETYRARIAAKFGLRSRADLIRFAVETGVLAPATDDPTAPPAP